MERRVKALPLLIGIKARPRLGNPVGVFPRSAIDVHNTRLITEGLVNANACRMKAPFRIELV